MTRAVNPQTGEVFELQDGQWVSVGKEDAKPAAAPLDAGRVGVMEATLASAGDQLTTWGRNARDLYASATGNVDAQARIEDERVEAEQVRESLRRNNPYASMVGAALPGLATLPLGMGIGGARLAGMAGTAEQIGLGTALSAMSSESGDIGGAAGMGLGWGLAGSLASNMVARVQAGRAAARELRQAGAMGGALHEGERAVLEGARRSGMRVTPGQATGSRQARQLEAALSSNPLTSEVFQTMEQANATQLNTLAARAMGVEGVDNVGPAVRAAAESAIGRDFRAVGNAIGEVPTAKLYKDLQLAAAEEATAGLPTSEAWKVLKRFEKGMQGRGEAVAGQVADTMHGSQLVKMRSQVAKEMRDAFSSNRSDKGEVLAGVLEHIDEAIGDAARVAGREDVVQRYGQAREAWSVLRAMDRGGATPDGNVLSGQAARLMKQSDKRGFWGMADEADDAAAAVQSTLRGGTGKLGEDAVGDFYDALRWRSSQLGKPIVGDSGTATRSAVGQWLQGGSTLGTAANLGKRLTASPVMKAYANMSPEAAAQVLAVQEAMRRAGSAGARTGAVIGGRGEPTAAQAWGMDE